MRRDIVVLADSKGDAAQGLKVLTGVERHADDSTPLTDRLAALALTPSRGPGWTTPPPHGPSSTGSRRSR